MITCEEYWNQMESQHEVVEHLGQIYCGKTRCLLTQEDKQHIYEVVITAIVNTQAKIHEEEERQQAIQQQKDFEDLKAKRRNDIIEFSKGKTNSYNRDCQEKAYWTHIDCLHLIDNATTVMEIETAYKIFDRYKYYL